MKNLSIYLILWILVFPFATLPAQYQVSISGSGKMKGNGGILRLTFKNQGADAIQIMGLPDQFPPVLCRTDMLEGMPFTLRDFVVEEQTPDLEDFKRDEKGYLLESKHKMKLQFNYCEGHFDQSFYLILRNPQTQEQVRLGLKFPSTREKALAIQRSPWNPWE
ncbi:MAG: hypothetical protein H6581_31025 [Bacteroidia bacterium]|nr:hypothetical protein [Bacteroidia bacterium]